jgi:hypothetical protein
LSPEQRSIRGRIAAHTLHAQVDDREHTAPARAAFLKRFEHQVPPEITDPAERARRAQQLLKAHMARLALASSKARSHRRPVP